VVDEAHDLVTGHRVAPRAHRHLVAIASAAAEAVGQPRETLEPRSEPVVEDAAGGGDVLVPALEGPQLSHPAASRADASRHASMAIARHQTAGPRIALVQPGDGLHGWSPASRSGGSEATEVPELAVATP